MSAHRRCGEVGIVQARNVDMDRSFESAFAELEEVVRQLEEGDLSLEQAISLYERGRVLTSFCQRQLDQAELRVNQLESVSTEGDVPLDEGAC